MEQQETSVVVYSFRMLGMHVELPEIAGYKATPEAIESLGGEVLPGTAQQVPVSELDERGRYRRINTGWGGLG